MFNNKLKLQNKHLKCNMEQAFKENSKLILDIKCRNCELNALIKAEGNYTSRIDRLILDVQRKQEEIDKLEHTNSIIDPPLMLNKYIIHTDRGDEVAIEAERFRIDDNSNIEFLVGEKMVALFTAVKMIIKR